MLSLEAIDSGLALSGDGVGVDGARTPYTDLLHLPSVARRVINQPPLPAPSHQHPLHALRHRSRLSYATILTPLYPALDLFDAHNSTQHIGPAPAHDPPWASSRRRQPLGLPRVALNIFATSARPTSLPLYVPRNAYLSLGLGLCTIY